MTIDIESMTLKELRELRAVLAKLDGPAAINAVDDEWDHVSLPIGSVVVVATVLPIYVGRLVRVSRTQITLQSAAWVPDTGRAHEFAAGKEPAECEPDPEDSLRVIERSCVVTTTPGKTLLRAVK